MAWYRRIANIFRRDRLGQELDDELAFHVRERTDDLIARGWTPAQAHREARRRFGSVAAQREETRDMDVARSLEAFLGDLRYSARQLRLNPGFASVAVLSLALGIGANSAIFQLINALRLRSLPVEQPSQLAAVGAAEGFRSSGWHNGRHRTFTFPQYEQMLEQQEAFSGLAAFGTDRFNLSVGGESRYAEGIYITPNFLEVLGVAPAVGNWMRADADPADCAGAGVLLDYFFWKREYQGDADVVGRDIHLNGRSFPILGVTPESFFGVEPGRRFQVAIPVCADALLRSGDGRLPMRWAWWLTPIGRLKPGWSVERASAHMRDVSGVIFSETQPETYRPDTLKEYLENKLRVLPAQSGFSSMRRDYENPLWILFACTSLVLLIACSNLANLLLARASVREREVALRQAVGASRRRLIAQLMSESLLLAGLGAVFGAGVASLLGRGLVLFIADGQAQVDLALGIDWRVFGFTSFLAAATCLLFGLTPALKASRTAPTEAMRGGRGAASVSAGHGLRRGLIVSQIALSFVLLVGALLFGQSLGNLLHADAGLESEGVVVARLSVRQADLESDQRREVYRRIEENVNASPDVVLAAFAENYPFSNSAWDGEVYADDGSPEAPSEAWYMEVNPGYFRTLEMPLLAGRDFDRNDDLTAPKVAVVNEKFARDLFGDSNPIGRVFRREAGAGEPDPAFQIVGLVKNARYRYLREEPLATAFFPIAQDQSVAGGMNLVIRSRGPFGPVRDVVRREMAAIDPGLLVEFVVLEERMERTVTRERLMATLSGGFGVLAALLSTLGLYGVMSYMVARRRNEFGVRMALGAQRGDVRGLVLHEAGRLLLIGLVFGLAGALALSRYAESLLFGLAPNDATTLALGTILLTMTALGAALFPVRRAVRLDPAVVLRDS